MKENDCTVAEEWLGVAFSGWLQYCACISGMCSFASVWYTAAVDRHWFYISRLFRESEMRRARVQDEQ